MYYYIAVLLLTVYHLMCVCLQEAEDICAIVSDFIAKAKQAEPPTTASTTSNSTTDAAVTENNNHNDNTDVEKDSK